MFLDELRKVFFVVEFVLGVLFCIFVVVGSVIDGFVFCSSFWIMVLVVV